MDFFKGRDSKETFVINHESLHITVWEGQTCLLEPRLSFLLRLSLRPLTVRRVIEERLCDVPLLLSCKGVSTVDTPSTVGKKFSGPSRHLLQWGSDDRDWTLTYGE